MIKEGLLGEFFHETENTRKLLQAIPDEVLQYRPQPHLWSIAELSAHIAGIYRWYEPVYNSDELNMIDFDSEKVPENVSVLMTHFERYAAEAEQAIKKSDEQTYFDDWSLLSGDHILLGPIKKIAAIRGILCSHLYHHRGELVAYLRVNGCKVPGLYGPSYDELHQG